MCKQNHPYNCIKGLRIGFCCSHSHKNTKKPALEQPEYLLYWIVYYKELGREPLEVYCDRTVRAGGAMQTCTTAGAGVIVRFLLFLETLTTDPGGSRAGHSNLQGRAWARNTP